MNIKQNIDAMVEKKKKEGKEGLDKLNEEIEEKQANLEKIQLL